jgi:hypothetical protein
VKQSVLVPLCFLAACSSNGPSEQQAILDQMANSCNLPDGSLHYQPDGNVQFNVKPDDKYEDVDCLLRKLKKSQFIKNIGFVGNEQYRAGEEQK